eukprot:TRINITY_DN2288_c0_g1_i1.p1 TRINITY_DN2288_c0_g1~~TRINITY_DN2288_c0_g1_i1.p1  ORF type:complete len:583 (-),score=111.95 TRINITY_DN2288_c0_g1_i1:11-1759(-)
MNLWNGISEKLFSTAESSPFPPWSTVERRVRGFRDFLLLIKGRAEAKQAAQNVIELLPLFEHERFDLTGEYHETFDYVRTMLLDIWQYLLFNLDNVTSPDANNFYKAIAFIMRRREFDVTNLRIDPDSFELAQGTTDKELSIARRYRHLLYSTQGLVSKKLSVIAQNLATGKTQGPPLLVYAFFAKVLAINYFRLMGLSRTLLGAIVLNEPEQDFVKEVVEATEKNFLEAEQDMSVLIPAYPNIFQWNQYHSVLAHLDSEDEQLRNCPKEWLEEFRKRDLLFFLFVTEWVNLVKQSTNNLQPAKNSSIPQRSSKVCKWYSIKGYKEIVQATLFTMKSKDLAYFNRVLTDCLSSLVSVEPALINFYMYFTFSRTNVYETTAVMETLSYVDVWFKEIMKADKRLSNDFDVNYFCKAISIMIETEHHQLILRVLTLIYNYAEIFSGKITRKTLLIDVLLKQYFFKLFLHWESSIRNAYQQIIVFKMLRERRSRLQKYGFLTDSERPKKDEFDTLHEDYELDGMIYSKIESYVKLLQSPGESYPANWQIYSRQALQEYDLFMRVYEQWEQKAGVGERPPPMQVLHA